MNQEANITFEEMKSLFKNHDTVRFVVSGIGETVLATYLFKDAIAELERLAEIGRATEKAFDYFSMGQPSEEGTIEFDVLSVEDLLEWAKEVG